MQKEHQMKKNLQFIHDDKGIKTAVIVPFDQWEKINADYQKILKKLEVIQAVEDGMIELKNSKNSGDDLQTLSEFVNESKS